MKATCYTIAAILTGMAAATNAQEESGNLNREMTLEREYNPAILDANKVNTLPVVKEPEIRKTSIDYADFTLPVNPEKGFNLFPSGDVMTALSYNKRHGYLNLAGGMYANLNGDFGYHFLDTDKDQFYLSFSHRSTHGNLKYVQYEEDLPVQYGGERTKAKLNDNLGSLAYRHIFDKATFQIGAQYGYSAFNYYGLPREIYLEGPQPDAGTPPFYTPADRETNQATPMFHAYTGVASKKDARVGYLLDVDYRSFSYKYGLGKVMEGAAEQAFSGKFDLNAASPNNSQRRAGISGQVRYFSYNLPPTVEVEQPSGDREYNCFFEDRLYVTVSPYYRIDKSNWHLNLGVNVMFLSGEEYGKKVAVSPNIFADVEVAAKTVLYATADGSVLPNGLYEVSRLNRYIDPTRSITPSQNWLDSRVGIKSGALPGFWFDIFGGYKFTKDDFFFLPGRGYEENDFGSLYGATDGMNSRLLFGGVQLKYNYAQLFELSLKGVYNKWTVKFGEDWTGGSPDTEHLAYGRPETEITAGLTLRPADKFSVGLDYYLANGRYTKLFDYQEVKLKNINELNLTASYRINDTFGFYVRLNNLLFQKYEIYYGYPMQGFNAMAGININF